MRITLITSLSILTAFLLSFTNSDTKTYSIKITVSKIRNKNGKIQFQLYKDQSSFAKEKPYKLYRVSKSGVSNGKLTYTISGLPAGTYGVALLDDENNNKEMDYGLVLPNEGFGFSNYYHSGWSRPVFDDFKFKLDSDKNVAMIVRYV